MGGGWHTLYSSDGRHRGAVGGTLDANDKYRVFFGMDGQVGIMDLPRTS